MTENIYKVIVKIKQIKPSVIIAAFVSAFFLVSTANFKLVRAIFTDIAFVQEVNVLFFVFAIAFITMSILALSYFLKRKWIIPLALVASTVIYLTALAMVYHESVWFYAGCMILLLIVFLYFSKNTQEFKNETVFTYRNNLILAAFLCVSFTVITACSTIYRYKSYGAACFDFGIFSQMFEYMRTTGLPDTTVEKNKLVSHFAVHFSPIFYLLLPGYMIFPNPCYLLIIQALCIGLGVFAVPGICRELDVKPKYSMLFTFIYILYPTLSYGQNFDFHENKFLTVCIMWTLYFVFRRKYVPMYVFMLFTCMIKEDAAIYVVAIALFMVFERKDIKHGLITLALALTYFAFALKMVTVCGGGENEFGYRYMDFHTGGNVVTIGDILKGIFLDFGYGLKVMFTDQKFIFFFWMMMPVAFLPFLTKKISTLLLITPMIFVNFLSSWRFQVGIEYQYTFGAAALIIVSAIYVFSKLPKQTARTAVGLALSMCIITTMPMFSSQLKRNYRHYKKFETMYQQRDEVLENIPRDVSVVADSCLVAHIADIKELYPDSYEGEKTDYIIIDMFYPEYVEKYEKHKNDYTGILVSGKCIVLKRNDLATDEEKSAERLEYFNQALEAEANP